MRWMYLSYQRRHRAPNCPKLPLLRLSGAASPRYQHAARQRHFRLCRLTAREARGLHVVPPVQTTMALTLTLCDERSQLNGRRCTLGKGCLTVHC